MAYKNIEQNREYNRTYQKENLRRLTELKKLKRQQRVAWVQEQKQRLTCKHCGEKHPATLEFHHRNPEEKVADISVAARKNWSMERLLSEMAKCDVVCANCHRKLHWKQ